ncbi:MAG: small subunit ribosomal protein S8 [Chloroflexi bacterium]|jgi:small subunit ribosomal protein S8|nr:MAG: small subunit ribosomal protein S8 [Chloroflexota bacterium]|tara:strand:+ start:1522 stop:1920 length:399 start_codon:yes stop_codon:yes gene_type:complete
MSVNDPIADMFTRIRNAAAAQHDWVDVPASNVKRSVANVLLSEGFLSVIKESNNGPQSDLKLKLTLGQDQRAIIEGIKRVSKPGLRVYVKKGEIPRVLGGLGIALISTSQGIMSDKEAWKRKIGGEILGYVW